MAAAVEIMDWDKGGDKWFRVRDDEGGESTYRMDQLLGGKTGAAVVWDGMPRLEFDQDRRPILRQDQPGLPDTIRVLISVGTGSAGSGVPGATWGGNYHYRRE